METPINTLNQTCHCRNTDHEALQHQLGPTPPHLFASVPVFVGREALGMMARTVAAIESVVRTPAYREATLAWAPPVARFQPGAGAGLLGYDFHLTSAGPQLIEVNTNPGGALLNVSLARAQRACGRAPHDPTTTENAIAAVFDAEWHAQRPGAALRTVAIVDDAPDTQYLRPEFILYRELFERRGIHAVICDPRELERRDRRLWYRGIPIDLVYNRLTDFSLSESFNAELKAAYLSGEVVVTPNPYAHALRADKRNLTLLSDATFLRASGADEATVETLLATLPRTEAVTLQNGDDLWERRKHLFFKPTAGYGSKAAYRGDKLTRRVWQEILAGSYVAQAIVPPSERQVAPDGTVLKLDVRNYAFGGEVLLVAARLYQGQTTNFRTPHGGFAPVLGLVDSSVIPGSRQDYNCEPVILENRDDTLELHEIDRLDDVGATTQVVHR